MSGAVAVAVLIAAVGGAALVDYLGEDEGAAELASYARDNAQDPIPFITRAARSHRLLFLSDVPPLAAPKRIAADAIAGIADSHGLDAVVLEIPSDHQEVIDRYLESGAEDASMLLSRRGVVPAVEGSSRPYLSIYERVRAINDSLGPARRIRIIAADVPEWPPGAESSPREMVRQYADRNAYMAERVGELVLSRDRTARILFFVGGLHLLRDVQPRIAVGGGSPVTVRSLAALLQDEQRQEVYTILMDGAPRATAYSGVAAYTATGALDIFRESPIGGQSFALPVGGEFDILSEPLRVGVSPGVELEFRPRDYELSDAADGYIYLAGRSGR